MCFVDFFFSFDCLAKEIYSCDLTYLAPNAHVTEVDPSKVFYLSLRGLGTMVCSVCLCARGALAPI